jgi:hypothetical protein
MQTTGLSRNGRSRNLFDPFAKGRGEGGDPPTPPHLFFKEGITPPPMCRPNRGVPPPPQVPAGPCDHNSGKPPDPTSHAGDSTRNTGFGHAEKEPVADKGGRGVIPLPPLSLFFRRGSPPTLVSGQVGGTHPPFGEYRISQTTGLRLLYEGGDSACPPLYRPCAE